MDLVMPGMDSFTGDEQNTEALSAGATGYLLKTARAEDVAQAIRNTAAGRPTVAPEVLRRMVDRMKQGGRPSAAETGAPAAGDPGNPPTPGEHQGPGGEPLTPREREVLALIGDGLSNQEIADRLVIGIRTVKTHVSNLLAKLQLADRTQLAVYANRHGLTGEELRHQ